MKECSKEKQYAVSVVMAVYNVELYLREAIDSVINQSFGFDRIQLILVDDGSADGSGSICDEYGERYPENVLVIHKKNGGVSSARNEGLNHVKGRFVNFLDGDDKLSKDTVAIVYDFFMAHLDETDVVAVQLQFFDARTGAHILNYKFEKGDRVIDLNTDWSNPQLHVCSSFVKAERFEEYRFDTRLAYAEDAQLLQKILLRKAALGVVQKPVYWYRRRGEGPQSAIQSSLQRREWYLPYMRYFQHETIHFYLNNKGYLPLFVQYTLMYDLQFRLKLQKFPMNVLTKEEETEFLSLIRQTLSYIQTEVILEQKYMFREHKLFALRLKDSSAIQKIIRDNDIAFCVGDEPFFKVSDYMIRLEFLELTSDSCVVEGLFSVLTDTLGEFRIAAKIGGQLVEAESYGSRSPEMGLGQEIQHFVTFKIRLPLTQRQTHQIQFFCLSENLQIPLHRIRYSKFFPVSSGYRYCSYAKDCWVVSCWEKGIKFTPRNNIVLACREIALYRELLLKHKEGECSAVLYRIALHILRLFKRKKLWLVSDRVIKAGDNGEAFFRYMRSEHPEIDTRFVIRKESPDYQEMKKIGPVVNEGAWFHKLLLLLSDCVISSAGEEEVYNPFPKHDEPYRDITAIKNYVFLQHGVIGNDLSNWLGRPKKNIRGFVTTAKPEYESIVNGNYHYTEKQVWLTGLPRFDRLYQDSRKWITIMPTWRKYLMDSLNRDTGKWSLRDTIKGSSFIRFYNALLNDRRLLDAAEKHGYEIKFLPHPTLQSHLDLFEKNDRVAVLGMQTAYRDIYAHSDLVVTDYSSAVFDFAYLRKPLIYTQFDADEFFAGEHVCTKGYFDYERDGFGEVEHDLDGTVNRIIEYMEDGCRLKDEYADRVEKFFAFNDRNNCQRVYEKLMALDEAQD